MATLPTPEENARKILRVYQDQDIRPGDTIPIMMISEHLNWHTDDVLAGLEYGVEHGWFQYNEQSKFVMLTDAGYAEI